MDVTSDSRFDPNLTRFATTWLLDIARAQSLKSVMEKLLNAGMARPSIAHMEIWLIEKGDICSRCPQRAECPDQTRCLHLVAWRSKPLSVLGEGDSGPYNSDMRIPLGVGVIGRMATTGQPIVLQDLDRGPSELSRLDWLRREQVHGFAGTPISFQGESLGVIASFDRENITEETRVWRQIFTDHVGGVFANARAFEEIQRLKAQLEMHNAYLQEEVVEAKAFGELVGQSATLRQIVSQIDLVAPTDASVLILGATGTGKELIAREIHRRSRRKDKPMVRVNCASVPRDLYESEFFGHVKGAFTGAIRDRAGRFETAEGGTLFLDEIGEVPMELQGKLLRVLQEKCYERVGEDRTRHADVRIIAASNRNLKEEVDAGRFREDLYYRLSVFPMQVATLKEREEDIPLLAKHFVEMSVKELRCPKPRLTRAGVLKLQSYDWPGNVRELRNVIERAVILARGGPLNFDLPVTAASSASSPGLKPLPGNKTAPEFLTDIEMQHLERENLLVVLQKTGWKIKGPDGAAELIGLKPTTLLTRMKAMGIKRPGK
jgi:transcriptional regulator with GAF, ATPase, and Fis domain